jgi:dihydroorotate dehydrogenase (NAD+) catalytic subunit
MDELTIDFSRPKFDLNISPPQMNAAGSLGYYPESGGRVDFSRLGVFVTNPISTRRRTPANSRTCQEYPGGLLLHSGYPNPGLREAIRRYAQRWARSPLPIIVHLLVHQAENVAEMVIQLEELEGVMGIELGLPPEVDPETALDLVGAAVGELPLIVRLPVERAGELARSLAESPVSAISLAPPRGALVGSNGEIVRGRLFGPAVFPLALGGLQDVLEGGLPVIAGGGVYEPWQAEACLEAGAIAVQLDSVLWSLGSQGTGED